MEIAATANHCMQFASVTQYTFQCIQYRMSEDEVYNKLSQILDSNATTVTRRNKTSTIVRRSNIKGKYLL